MFKEAPSTGLRIFRALVALIQVKIMETEQDFVEIEETSEELREACGIFGCIANGEWPTNLDVAHIIYLGLIALQHR